ncbi:dihydrofolate reductase [Alkaliphilus pronyensis]|uniref:Dihydrofolate reductase n=1 Tax=Alkaliphilus pronyensis TaxID=1482732 RepID=A0A6I0EYZ3_9FIRM|nr:NAD(P)-dependent oxidoreductase [Alkaliphilus pronyensis]KAB3531304.1 dihydrofolate reductase [Alkaliphilus pronyensis]
MKFNKIVSIDNTGLIPEVKEELRKLANDIVFYEDFPTEKPEIISRIGDADCVLVSWNTAIDKEVIEACSSIKYIGMCCSLYDEESANVDIKEAKNKGITVLGVKDYGDEGVIEFIFSELIRLLHGFENHQWREEALELTNQKLGIIGLGTLGEMLAKTAKMFGMEVYYYNRTRKVNIEKIGVEYLELEGLLKTVDILSTHLPRNTKLIDADKFKLFGSGKILINTSLGPTFNVKAFKEWIKDEKNYAIFDKAAMENNYNELKKQKNVIYTDKVAGWTKQAKARLSYKVLDNIKNYLSKK